MMMKFTDYNGNQNVCIFCAWVKVKYDKTGAEAGIETFHCSKESAELYYGTDHLIKEIIAMKMPDGSIFIIGDYCTRNVLPDIIVESVEKATAVAKKRAMDKLSKMDKKVLGLDTDQK